MKAMALIQYGNLKNWPKEVIAFTDGASRGNPGLASYGICVLKLQGEVLYECGETLGIQTNNFAEYFAVKKALELAKSQRVKKVTIKTDSQLLVKQLSGKYKVKSQGLKPLFKDCRLLCDFFEKVQFQHILREFNKRADKLANEALDES